MTTPLTQNGERCPNNNLMSDTPRYFIKVTKTFYDKPNYPPEMREEVVALEKEITPEMFFKVVAVVHEEDEIKKVLDNGN